MEDEKCKDTHGHIHDRLTALEDTQALFMTEFKQFRQDIGPIVEFFRAAQTVLKAGNWLRKIFWGAILALITLIGAAVAIKNLLR